MATGIPLHPDVKPAFENLTKKSKSKYIILNISKGYREVIVEKIKDVEPSVEKISEEKDRLAKWESEYTEFLEELPEGECRYIGYRFPFLKEGGEREKILFIGWYPELASVKSKMIFATSQTGIKDALNTLIVIEADGKEDLVFAQVLGRVLKMGV